MYTHTYALCPNGCDLNKSQLYTIQNNSLHQYNVELESRIHRLSSHSMYNTFIYIQNNKNPADCRK